MDLLIEIIIEIVFEGASSLVSSRRVPAPIRIIIAAIFLILYISVFGLIAFVAAALFGEAKYLFACVLTAADVILVFALVKSIVKYKRGRLG